MEAFARVLAAADGRVRLACRVESGCGSCVDSRGCGLRLLGRSGDAIVELPQQAGSVDSLAPGDLVRVTVQDDAMLKAAAQVYVPMLAGLLAGAVAGGATGASGDSAVAFGAALGIAAGWAFARLAASRRDPVVTVRRVLEGSARD